MRRINLSRRAILSVIIVMFLFLTSYMIPVRSQEEAKYTGSESCKECHDDEYDNFKKYAHKAKSFESINKMKKGLTKEEIKGCYHCHSTGYGRPGGFVSEESTPHLRNAGCEVCHGPGSIHIETGEPDDIKGDLDKDDCTKCHTAERVESFHFKPLIYGGAH